MSDRYIIMRPQHLDIYHWITMNILIEKMNIKHNNIDM